MLRKDILKKLKQHGVTPTPQRVEVAEILLARPQHLSADQHMDALKGRGSRVSKAAVYNSLKIFSEQDIVNELTVDSSRKFYDSTTHSHHHFYHVDSGQLSDIPESQVSISGLPPLPKGTEQESVEVLIRVRDKGR